MCYIALVTINHRAFAVLMSCVLLGLCLGGTAMASEIEEPKYTLVRKYPSFEVRDYASHVVARTKLGSDYKQSLGAGFRRLAGFIFGGNAGHASIAMTAPVASSVVGNQWVVTFAMPSAYSIQTLPKPDDARVELVEVPAQRTAVLSFSGWVGHEKMMDKERSLRGELERARLKSRGPAVLAQYNPPWTLPFLRRNEIQIALEP